MQVRDRTKTDEGNVRGFGGECAEESDGRGVRNRKRPDFGREVRYLRQHTMIDRCNAAAAAADDAAADALPKFNAKGEL